MAPRIVAGNLIGAIQRGIPDDEMSLTEWELRRLEQIRLEYFIKEKMFLHKNPEKQ